MNFGYSATIVRFPAPEEILPFSGRPSLPSLQPKLPSLPTELTDHPFRPASDLFPLLGRLSFLFRASCAAYACGWNVWLLLTGMDGGVCFPCAFYVLVWMALFNVFCEFSLAISACACVRFYFAV